MRRLLALTMALFACLAAPGLAAALRTTAAGHVRYAICPEGAWPDPSLTATRSRVVILFPYLWAMDIGNPAFQRAWADEVAGELRTQGWDGVFIDNVNPTIRYYHDPADVARYPSDATYSAAVTSALAHIVPTIHAAGKLAMANIGSWPSYPAAGARWLRYLDGAMDERFTKFTAAPGQGYRSSAEWHTELSILRQVQREGKWFMGIAQSSDGDIRAERFGWATTLLGSGGHATFALQDDANYGVETWFSDYEAPIGHPLAAASQRRSGIELRRFSHGLVVVNPTARSHAVRLNGRYSGDGLRAVTVATVNRTLA
jgi:Hypothetical glycosyl hydrolase family 15